MITLRGDEEDGGAVAILGLTKENIERLMAGLPINAPLERINIPGVRVIVMYGETEQKIIRLLEEAGAVPPGTASDMPALTDPDREAVFNAETGEWKDVPR